MLLFFDFGTGEIFLIVLFVLIFFGSKKLPEFARGLGKGIRQFKDAAQGIQDDIRDSVRDVNTELNKNKQEFERAAQQAGPVADQQQAAEKSDARNPNEKTENPSVKEVLDEVAAEKSQGESEGASESSVEEPPVRKGPVVQPPDGPSVARGQSSNNEPEGQA